MWHSVNIFKYTFTFRMYKLHLNLPSPLLSTSLFPYLNSVVVSWGWPMMRTWHQRESSASTLEHDVSMNWGRIIFFFLPSWQVPINHCLCYRQSHIEVQSRAVFHNHETNLLGRSSWPSSSPPNLQESIRALGSADILFRRKSVTSWDLVNISQASPYFRVSCFVLWQSSYRQAHIL